MKIAPRAEHVSMNAPLRPFRKAIFIKSTPMFAPTAEPVQMYAR